MPWIEEYEVDDMGFILDGKKWNEGFVHAAAAMNKIEQLNEDHWSVIRFIRQYQQDTGLCPLVYRTCRANRLTFRKLRVLFPTGYLRGACRMAGITYREGYLSNPWSWTETPPSKEAELVDTDKVYGTDARGFLADPKQWDREFAIYGAENMEIPGGLSSSHWNVINWLRERYREKGAVPTVYETCESLEIELEDLERLFPRGYHRGAVKLAGLRVR